MAMDEEFIKKRELDRYYRLRMLTELLKHPHPLTHQADSTVQHCQWTSGLGNGSKYVPDAVKLGQGSRTSFASSLPGGFHHPIKKTVETMQVLKRGRQIKETTVYGLEAVFVNPSLIDEYGCIRKGRKAVRKVLLGMYALSGSETVSYPNGRGNMSPSKYSLKRTSTNLIQSWWRTVLLGETCSQRELYNSFPLLPE